MYSTNRQYSSILFLCLIIFMVLSWNGAGYAATRVVESVDVSSGAAGTDINFNFSVPMQYLSHFREKSGKLLQIELRSMASIQDVDEFTRRYKLSWNKSATDLLTEISYEGNATGKIQLLLRFRQPVNSKLFGSPNPRNLKIGISPVGVAATEGTEKSEKQDSDSELMPKNSYAINLISSLTPFDPAAMPTLELLKQYQLYTTEFKHKGRTWYRLRVGFFHTRQDAEDLFKKLKNDFPEAWITKAPESDLKAAKAISKVEVAPAEQPIPPEAESSAGLKELQLFDEAKSAMVDNDYRRAVQIYTKLSQSTDPAIRQQAQEFLGLARERNGQMAHAKAEYEKYLKLYPEGEGTERVKQRLAGLLTQYASPKGNLRKAKKPVSENEWQSEFYGSFSQFYDRDETFTQADEAFAQEEETILNRSALSSDLDLNALFHNDDFDIQTTFLGGMENDFREDGDDDFRISSLYIDALARRLDLSTRIGRQSRSSGGVLGRFDGGLLRWQMNDSVAVNLVAGFPVFSTTETDIDTDRPLYGISFDLGTFAKSWDFNTYFISQDVDGIIDRQAVGGEVRYFARSLSFFSLIDYDISYNELNTALLTANYTLPSSTSFNMSIDYRNSPILTTSNALLGQTATSIDALLQTYSEDEVRQLARDRTATSRSFTIGVTHPLSQKLQINSDLTLAKFSSTPASGGVDAQPGTDYDYFYSLQLVGSSLIKQGDLAIIGLRYSDTDRLNTYSGVVNTRYPVTRELRINPQAVIDYRSNKEDDGEQWKFRPSLLLEYLWKKRYYLEVEGGGEWSSNRIADQVDDTSGYFFIVGYRINF